MLEYIANHKVLAFDFETSPLPGFRNENRAALDPARSDICTLSLSVEEGTGIMIPVGHQDGNNMPENEFFNLLRMLMTNPGIVKIAHNMSFEATFCYKHGIVIQEPVYDTIAAAQMTLKAPMEYRTLSDSGLKTLALNLFQEPLPSFTTVTGGQHFDEKLTTDPETIRYSCADSDFALRLYHKFNGWFDRYLPQHRWIVEKLESPTAVFVGMMKYNGVPVDIDAMRMSKRKAEEKINRLHDEILEMTDGAEIGSNCSTTAFKLYLYETRGLPVLKQTEKGVASADDEAMLLLKKYCEEHNPDLAPLFDKVLEYRKWQKVRSTYLDGYLEVVNPVTSRIHPNLMQLATETGRFACRNPNLQNMPQKGQDPVGIRNFIKAPSGWVLLESDYSQAEIRLCAYLAREPVLLEAYLRGEDIHAITTAAIFHISLEEAKDKSRPDYKHRRTVAKMTMFGIMYGISGMGLSRNLFTNAGIMVSPEECDEYIASILRKYPGLERWQKQMKASAEQTCFIETALGRRRYLPGIRSRDRATRRTAQRMAMNTPVQGLGADCLKYAMGQLVGALGDKPWIRPVLTVHDSIVFLVQENQVEEAQSLVKRCMETPPPLDNFMPLVAEVSVGTRYGEMD